MTRIPGRATPEGTARYAARHADATAPGHFRRAPSGLTLSSLGLGSYLGEADDATDRAYEAAFRTALGSGVNVLDSAVNYRHMRSERALGRSLAGAIERGEARRDEVVVATKGGFIAFDGDVPSDPRGWFTRSYLVTGLLERDDVVAGMHAMNPAFLEHQLGRSLENLGVETVDVYYLHNPETQRPEIGPERFRERLGRAFGFLERQIEAGRVRAYGLATWHGFVAPRERPDHLALEEVLEVAREVGGDGHGLRVIQLPLSAAMTGALVKRNQGAPDRPRTVLEVAAARGLTVMASASLLQGRLAALTLPELAEEDLPTPALQALQFARSAPGVATALVGTRDAGHLDENLGIARVPPVDEGRFRRRYAALLRAGAGPQSGS